MRQTLAIFIDAYRELNAKKLFWIVLMLSGLCVAGFALVGITPTGLKIIVWDFDLPMLNTSIMSEETFYKAMFSTLGIGIWLTWIATILALVSTAGLIPDFISSGSIDLVLSKPMGRLRLFLTKYAAGMLFVTLQVVVFCVASFLVIGLRGDTWEPGIFVSIPIVVCFFSYLFSVCVLLGLLTRSTIASLMITLLLWAGLWGINTVETVMLDANVGREMRLEAAPTMIESRETALPFLRSQVSETEASVALLRAERAALRPDSGDDARALDRQIKSAERKITRLEQRITQSEQEIDSIQTAADKIEATTWPVTWHRISFGLKTILPKTSETVSLLERSLISMADLEESIDANEAPPFDLSMSVIPLDQGEKTKRIIEVTRARSVWWVVGTSLLFEAVVLGLASLIFCRRDF